MYVCMCVCVCVCVNVYMIFLIVIFEIFNKIEKLKIYIHFFFNFLGS